MSTKSGNTRVAVASRSRTLPYLMVLGGVLFIASAAYVASLGPFAIAAEQVPASAVEERPRDGDLAIAIAIQGDQALRQIREDAKQNLRAGLQLPALTAPAQPDYVAAAGR